MTATRLLRSIAGSGDARLDRLALAVALLPIVCINLNYLLAASAGSVPWCVPYWDSCTSISATGRYGVAFYFFKATMLPQALLYGAYWLGAQKALERLGYTGKVIGRLGSAAVLALIVYVVALGIAGDAFQLSRRIGIIFYFTLTYLCQLLVVYRLRALTEGLRGLTLQLQLCAFILAIGLLTLVLDVSINNYDDYEDAFEWNIALLLHINFIVAATSWRDLAKKHAIKKGDGVITDPVPWKNSKSAVPPAGD